MKQVGRDKIRNVCLLAHGGAGKTSLAEAMLFDSGASDRLGKVEDGTTITDFDSEEIKRRISINTAIASFMHKDVKLNIIDTPGYFDFVGEILQGVRVADSAVIVVCGKSGVSVGTENSWAYCNERNIPRLFFVNKLDDDRADYAKVIQSMIDVFGKAVVPFQLPIKEGEHVIGVVDIVHMKGLKFNKGKPITIEIPAEMMDEVQGYRDQLMELVAETDEDLMERFFAGDTFTDEEILKALKIGIHSCGIAPVFFGSALANSGVASMIECIADYCPSPCERPAEKSVDGKEIKLDDGNASALIFKTVADPYVGKISYFKVYSGTISNEMSLINSRTGEHEKIAHMFYVCGKKHFDTTSVSAGDIAAITKLADTKTGDTLSKNGIEIPGFTFPKPNLSLALMPKAKGDEEKISAGLHKLMDEDPTFNIYTNTETHQMIISGLGEQHLDVLASKLKTKFGVGVDMIEPRVPYRETIRKKVKVEGKHKKQSGGHGQYGHVWIEFEPGTEEGLTFAESVFGGSVPRNYFPAVEKGLQESILHGVLAGYPVVNLKATLVDGSYHPVDSSEMAFKLAAHVAYKKGMEDATSILLEPIGKLDVIIPESHMGDIIGDINKRRGRVLGMNPQSGGLQLVEAEVPMAAMHKYATDLRSMTGGRGKFTFEFVRYEEAPANVAQKVIEESKAQQH